jgi:HSP20 family protein
MIIFRFSHSSGRFEIAGVGVPAEIPRGAFRPPVDISFNDGAFTLRLDIPGVVPQDVSIEAGDHEITISGEIAQPNPPGPCRLMERPFGLFSRTLSIPGLIDQEKVEAHLSNGVLAIKVPVSNLKHDPTRIEVKIEGAD